MEGTVVFTRLDGNGNQTFGVEMEHEQFPVDADKRLLRMLKVGDSVTF